MSYLNFVIVCLLLGLLTGALIVSAVVIDCIFKWFTSIKSEEPWLSKDMWHEYLLNMRFAYFFRQPTHGLDCPWAGCQNIKGINVNL